MHQAPNIPVLDMKILKMFEILRRDIHEHRWNKKWKRNAWRNIESCHAAIILLPFLSLKQFDCSTSSSGWDCSCFNTSLLNLWRWESRKQLHGVDLAITAGLDKVKTSPAGRAVQSEVKWFELLTYRVTDLERKIANFCLIWFT